MKILKSLCFLFLTVVCLFVLKTSASAATYPIPELGNCQSQSDCFSFCEIPDNQPACWSYSTFILHKNVLGDATVSAQQNVKQHGITFPIAALGNCANLTECKAYCDQPANQDTCKTFAKERGLAAQRPTIDQQRLLDAAKNALGCDSLDSCKAFCEKAENRQKCLDFSHSQGIPTPTPKPLFTVSIFDAAQKELGCDSLTLCKEICGKQENYQKCQAFAVAHNLTTARPSGDQKPSGTPLPAGTLPCNSIETCSVYCGEHKDICLKYKDIIYKMTTTNPNQSVSLFEQLSNTTGCSTTEECYKYCVAHPDACPGFPKQLYPSPASTTNTYPTLYPTVYPATGSTTSNIPPTPTIYINPSNYPTYYPQYFVTPAVTPTTNSGTSTNTVH